MIMQDHIMLELRVIFLKNIKSEYAWNILQERLLRGNQQFENHQKLIQRLNATRLYRGVLNARGEHRRYYKTSIVAVSMKQVLFLLKDDDFSPSTLVSAEKSVFQPFEPNRLAFFPQIITYVFGKAEWKS